jgi:hypothetical protein
MRRQLPELTRLGKLSLTENDVEWRAVEGSSISKEGTARRRTGTRKTMIGKRLMKGIPSRDWTANTNISESPVWLTIWRRIGHEKPCNQDNGNV